MASHIISSHGIQVNSSFQPIAISKNIRLAILKMVGYHARSIRTITASL
jgi:hypothetical protein